MGRRLVLALAFLVLLAGCGGAGTGDDATQAGGAEQTITEAATDGDGGDGMTDGGAENDVTWGADGGGDMDVEARTQARYRIKTAQVELQVDSYDPARDALVSETRALGGYVDSESSDRHTRDNESWKTGTLVLRVPAENDDQLLAAVADQGTIQHRETKTRDVTERVVDLRARLRNLEVQRDRLRDLYESANETEDVLAVGQRLSQVQGEIERVEGQLQVLENRVAYSTIRVQLTEERPERQSPHEPPAWYETSVVGAFLDSVDGVIVLSRMVVVGVAYLAPFALAIGLPVLGLYGVARRFG